MDYKIEKWMPILDVPPKLYLEGLHDDYDGFRLLLKGEDLSGRFLKIEFTSHVGYRNIDESYRLKTLERFPILTSQWPLFVASNDEFINWICFESAETINNKLSHKNYIICTPNDIVEVISNEEPVVEWM